MRMAIHELRRNLTVRSWEVVSRCLIGHFDPSWDLEGYHYCADWRFFRSSLLTSINNCVLLASPCEINFYYKAIGRLCFLSVLFWCSTVLILGQSSWFGKQIIQLTCLRLLDFTKKKSIRVGRIPRCVSSLNKDQRASCLTCTEYIRWECSKAARSGVLPEWNSLLPLGSQQY